MEKRRVVVTGLGAITPLGKDVASSWEAVKANKCGIDLITLYDNSEMKVKVAGEVKDFDPTVYIDKKQARRYDRFTQFAIVAAKEAYQDSGLDQADFDHDRFGVIISSGIGGLGTMEKEHAKGLKKNMDRISPFYVPMVICNLAAGNVAIELNARGMCTCPVTACAGGTNAIGDAFRNIRDGYAEVMVAGGAEASITELGVGGFTSMHALSTETDPKKASIPFDLNRNGFVMGEGSGILILEEYEHAKRRKAKIYAEVVGYGVSCDAYHMTAPAEGGEGGARAMTSALRDADLQPEDISYINAHGTSTDLNDKFETAAVKAAFKEAAYKIPMSSTKSMTGHLLGAAGGIEGVFSVKALQDSFIPATIGYETPDPECDLDIVPNQGREQELHYVMSNSLGFGGHNATVIFKKFEV